jgi:hypothetical protein
MKTSITRNVLLVLAVALCPTFGCGDELDDSFDDSELRPELPICGNCKADIAKNNVANDDVLSISIDSSFKGLITTATFTTTDNMGTSTSMGLSTSVIEQINDETIGTVNVNFDGPQTASAVLEFHTSTGMTQTNVVTVDYY